jgi:hypothetical protein
MASSSSTELLEDEEEVLVAEDAAVEAVDADPVTLCPSFLLKEDLG